MRVISYGGGVQSTALLVLAAQGELGQVDAALFANVGDDSEHPSTLRYVRDVATPWAAARGLAVHELRRVKRDGSEETLMGRMMRPQSKSLPIPVRMANGAPGSRSCTVDFKLKVIARWLKAHGANRRTPADVLIGISFDEAHRIGNKNILPYEVPHYPLCDRRLTRTDCKRIIERAGLPLPGKSACYFCPYTKPSQWSRMRTEEPILFYQAAELERLLNERRATIKTRPVHKVWLTRFNKPLAEACPPDLQIDLDFGAGPGETCDEGYCWT